MVPFYRFPGGIFGDERNCWFLLWYFLFLFFSTKKTLPNHFGRVFFWFPVFFQGLGAKRSGSEHGCIVLLELDDARIRQRMVDHLLQHLVRYGTHLNGTSP